MPNPAVILLSGGLDSATVLAIARKQGFDCHCLTIDYAQRHRAELHAATRVAESLGAASHKVLPIDLRTLGGSALTDDIDVPKHRTGDEIATGIPITYVPARNLVFLSLATGFAEVLGARDIYLGVNAVDFSGYPDCRPEFIHAFERTANLATKAGVEGHPTTIHTPLMDLTKADIIRKGTALNVDFALTLSCYDPSPDPSPNPSDDARACGSCDACILRRKGFASANIPDPTSYQ